jgi:hypothetical protein
MLTFFALLTSAWASPRVVAIGDLHADEAATKVVLKMAELIDDKGRWVGGTDVLIQTGDVTDKGPSSRDVIVLLSRLQSEARLAGGDILGVVGNHEVMNLVGDWRGVTPADLGQYDAPETRMRDLRPQGVMGQWIHSSHLVVFFDNTVFVHGGVSPQIASLGQQALSLVQAKHLGQSSMSALFDVQGPMWHRDYVLAPDDTACPALAMALNSLNMTRMVVGHTTQHSGRIASRCDGALIAIDTGISAYAGNHYTALELNNGKARAIYPHETQDLPNPKLRDK